MAGKASKYSSIDDVIEAALDFHQKADEAYDAMDFAKGAEEGRRCMELFNMVEGFSKQKNRCRYLVALCMERAGLVDEAEQLYMENWQAYCEQFGPCSKEAVKRMIAVVSLNCCALRYDRAISYMKGFLDSEGDNLDNHCKGLLLKELSYAQSDFSLHEEAFDSIIEAIELLKETSDEELLLDAYDLHAALHQERGCPQKALKVVEEAFEVSKKMGRESLTIRKRLGFVQFDIGMYKPALEVNEEALVDHLIRLGDDSTITLRCRANCSELYFVTGRYAEAEEQAIAVLDTVRKAHREDVEEMDGALTTAGCFYALTSQFKKGLELLEENYELLEDAYGHWHEDTASEALRYGDALSQCGRLQEGEQLMTDALPTLKTSSGDEHHLTVEAEESLGCHYRRCGRPREALELLRTSWESCKKITRPENPEAFCKAASLACVMAQLGDTTEAIALAKKCVSGIMEELGNTAPSAGTAYRALATVLLIEGDYELAMRAATEAEKVARHIFKDYHGYHGSTEEIEIYILYAECHILEGAYGKALERLTEADVMVEKVFSEVSEEEDHFEHFRIQNVRGRTLLLMGEIEKAAEELSSAVAGYERAFGSTRPHWEHGAALVELAKAYRLLGRQEDAMEGEERAREIFDDSLGEAHWRARALSHNE